MIYRFDITPVSKPRQTRSDVWKKRNCVVQYRQFADEIRALAMKQKFKLPDKFRVEFHLPTTKTGKHIPGEWHRQRPDIDNLLKALQDALRPEDSGICHVEASKHWAKQGSILIEAIDSF